MKRTLSALVLAASVGGCLSTDHNTDVNSKPTIRASGDYVVPTVPGISGPWGEPVPMAAPYTVTSAHVNTWQAQRMMSQSVPLGMVQMDPRFMQAGGQMPNGMPMMPPGAMMSPPGMPFSPPMSGPGGRAMPPANMPGGPMMPASAMTAPGCPPGGAAFNVGRTQIRFTGPDGMRIGWLAPGSDGRPVYSAPVVEAPGRYNFLQASIYRLKLSNIRGRPGLEVYPTLEVVPGNAKTAAFLAHSAVPLEFTPQDFQEIAEGKYLVKVIYLPDPQFQELAATGTDEIISTRLEPGADPILEAQRRGCILLVIRMGNVDQEAPNTPPLESPSANCGPMATMPAPAITGPSPMMSGNSMNSVPVSPPGSFGSSLKTLDASGVRPASAVQSLPEMSPRPPTSFAPAPLQSSSNLPPGPPMPRTPAELAAQPNQ